MEICFQHKTSYVLRNNISEENIFGKKIMFLSKDHKFREFQNVCFNLQTHSTLINRFCSELHQYVK